jgi:hypothetical protein
MRSRKEEGLGWAYAGREREGKKGGRLGCAEEKEKAGLGRARREKEREKEKRKVGRAQPVNEREKEMHSNAFEFEFKN